MGYTVFPNSIGKFAGPYLSNPFLLSKPQPSFAVNFDDNGSGIANLVVFRGAATPTFTRATTATTVLSTGLIGSVASGSPRSYYDPTTLEYLGYLAEGARTNLCLQSEDFSTTWALAPGGGANVSTNQIVSPDGTQTADKLTASSGGGRVQQSFITADTVYTFSVFVKKSNSTLQTLLIRNTTTASNVGRIQFNLDLGTVSSAIAGEGVIQEYQNGWYRCSVIVSSGITATDGIDAYIYAGDIANSSGDSVYLWGAQLEVGYFNSSYVQTTTASVARNDDVLVYSTSGFLNDTQGTFFCEATTFHALSTGTNKVLVNINDGTTDNRVMNLINAAGKNYIHIFVGTVDQGTFTTDVIPTDGVSFKTANCYKLNDYALVTDGSSAATDTSADVPTVSQVNIGANGGGFFGPIRRVAYYPRRLSNGQLQNLTT